MRTQSIGLAMAALLLMAGTAALAAQTTTIVGTIETKTAQSVQVRTDDGLQTFSTKGLKMNPTLAEGDIVRVSYTTANGSMTASRVARVETVTVTLPKQAGVEQLIVDEVTTGSLSSLAGLGDVKAKVMMGGNNRVTIRTADDNAPVVAFRTHLPKGITNFQTGERILLRVPSPVINDQMVVNTEPVLPPTTTVARYEAVKEPEPELVMAQNDPTPTPTRNVYYNDDRLPSTASSIHATGLAGLALIATGLGLGLIRRIW